MPECTYPRIQRVLILHGDCICAEGLQQFARRGFPSAKIQRTATVDATETALEHHPIDLLITGSGSAAEGDVLEFLWRNSLAHARYRHVLVVTTHREHHFLSVLRVLAVSSVFDASTENSDRLVSALHTTAAGGRYWSPSIDENSSDDAIHAGFLNRILTTNERVVLSVIGDGRDDDTAARELGVSSATIATVRRDLHRKLRVQHRGDLIKFAAQYGFIRFTSRGVERPGFRFLSAANNARRPKTYGPPTRPQVALT